MMKSINVDANILFLIVTCTKRTNCSRIKALSYLLIICKVFYKDMQGMDVIRNDLIPFPSFTDRDSKAHFLLNLSKYG